MSIFFTSGSNPETGSVIIADLQIRELRLREGKSLAQDHTLGNGPMGIHTHTGPWTPELGSQQKL